MIYMLKEDTDASAQTAFYPKGREPKVGGSLEVRTLYNEMILPCQAGHPLTASQKDYFATGYSYIGGTSKDAIDFFPIYDSVFVISERFKELIEDFAPGLHDFIAVDVLHSDDMAPPLAKLCFPYQP